MSTYKCLKSESDFKEFLRNNEDIRSARKDRTLASILIEGSKKYESLRPKIVDCAKGLYNTDPENQNNEGDISIFIKLVKAIPDIASTTDFEDLFEHLKKAKSKNFSLLFDGYAAYCAKKGKHMEIKTFWRDRIKDDEELRMQYWDIVICNTEVRTELIAKHKDLNKWANKLAREYNRTPHFSNKKLDSSICNVKPNYFVSALAFLAFAVLAYLIIRGAVELSWLNYGIAAAALTAWMFSYSLRCASMIYSVTRGFFIVASIVFCCIMCALIPMPIPLMVAGVVFCVASIIQRDNILLLNALTFLVAGGIYAFIG